MGKTIRQYRIDANCTDGFYFNFKKRKRQMIKCFFHSADLDGHCSGALVKLSYQFSTLAGNPVIVKMIPFNYNKHVNFNDIDLDDIVYAVDISFTPEEMLEMKSRLKPNNFIWIDHHITAINNSKEYHYDDLKGLRVVGYAACELTYQYFKEIDKVSAFPSNMPAFVRLLGRYDVWDYKDILNLQDHKPSDILPFQYGMRRYDTMPMDEIEQFWTDLLLDPSQEMFNRILSEGRLIYQYQRQQWDSLANNTWISEFEGLRFLTTSIPGCNSLFFDKIFDPTIHDACAVIRCIPGRYSVSLYQNTAQTKDIDLSVIAKKYGGGGHKGACGYPCDLDHLINNFLK